MDNGFSLNLYRDAKLLGIVTRSEDGRGFSLRYGDIRTPIAYEHVVPLELAELMVKGGFDRAQSILTEWEQAHPSDDVTHDDNLASA